MSPSASFTIAWEEMQPRLLGFLRRRGCDASSAEDIAQETGLRLFRNWEGVRRDSLWALTVTIAMNILKDSYRSKSRVEFVDELPDTPAAADTEGLALAKLELSKVAKVMTGLNPRYRGALLSIVDGDGDETNRMVRSRARSQLREQLGRVSAGVAAIRETIHRRMRLIADWNVSSVVGSAVQTLAAVAIAGGIALPATPSAVHPETDYVAATGETVVHRTLRSANVVADDDLPSINRARLSKTVVPPTHGGAEWTPLTVNETEVKMSPPNGRAGTDGSHTEATVEAEAGGHEVRHSAEADHPPPDCSARVDLSGDTAWYCEPEDRP